MDTNLLAEFKDALLKRQAQIKEELGAVATPDVGDHVPGAFAPKFDNFGDENSLEADSDSPDEVENYEENVAVTNVLERELLKVEAALVRINAGKYGKDINTGEEIPLERLRANPEAETVISKK